jgi:hypothetical protein
LRVLCFVLQSNLNNDPFLKKQAMRYSLFSPMFTQCKRNLSITTYYTKAALFRLAMGPTQPPIQLVPGFFLGSIAPGEWSWPLTFI